MHSVLSLLALSAGIIFTFMWREYINDVLYATKYGPQGEKFTFSVSVVFIQSVVNLLFAWIWPKIVSIVCPEKEPKDIKEVEMTKSPQSTRRKEEDSTTTSQAPVSNLLLAFELSIPALCQTLSGYMGNKSLEFVDMTTKTVCKAMKPVPILLFGVVMGNSYHVTRMLGVVALCCGIAGFTLGGSKSGGDEQASFYGFCLALGAVLMDGFVGSSQERITRIYKPSATLLMGSVHVLGIIISGGSLIMSGELPLLMDFATRYPEVWSQLIEMSVANPLGNFLVFKMITTFGPLQCSIVTTSRKFLTILFNTLWFGRHVSDVQWLSVVAVFVGVCLDMYGSGKDKEKARKDKQKAD